MADKQLRLVINFKSEEMMKRLERTANRIGIPKSTLALLALDEYLAPLPPPAPKRRAYERPKWAPTLEVVTEYFENARVKDFKLEAESFLEYYDDRQWRATKTNRKLTSWRGVAANWAKGKKKERAPVAADLGLGNTFLTDDDF